MIFVEGLEVEYKGHIGTIRFICDQYVTVCVKKFSERNRDVCLLVYREHYSNIKLLKESIK